MNLISTNRDEEIFLAAAALSASERAIYLEEACGGDNALRAQVMRLLASNDATGFMAESAGPFRRQIEQQFQKLKPETAGERIGHYKLVEQIGEGGFGTVWLAEQEEPVQRRVALKILKLGMDTEEVIVRFEQERQALAVMDHPNIAKVFDAGATHLGRPYFVMELVHGQRITDYCDEAKLPTRERLELFIAVCQAVQHAHQKGIIHRDLKPSNILVSMQDGSPVPKVIDFGVAKAMHGRLTEKTLNTNFEQMIGTPLYMSPEQAEMTSQDIDTRSDIYSLGVLLYELLTGRTPFSRDDMMKAGYREMRRLICEQEPRKPSTALQTMAEQQRTTVAARRHTDAGTLTTLVRGDLDWIVLKAIEKERTRRYETVNGLASDIRRHLECEPVIARPPSIGYRTGKFVRKHRALVVAVAAAVVALLAGLAATTVLYFREKDAWASEFNQRQKAETSDLATKVESAKLLQMVRFFESMLASINPDEAKGRDVALLKDMLAKTDQRLGAELVGQPMVEAEIRKTIGQVYEALGEFPMAEKNYGRAYDLARNCAGAESDPALTYRQCIAGGMHAAGRYQEAEAEYREILKIRERHFPPEDFRANEVRAGLAGTLASAARFADSEDVIRVALKGMERVVGADDNRLLNARVIHAGNLYSMERYQEGIDEFREILGIRVRASGEEHSATLAARFRLALLLEDQEENGAAEAEFRSVVETRTRILGEDHPSTLAARNRLAACMSSAGNYAAAEAEHRAVLALCEQKLRTDHPETIQCCIDLSNCLLAQQKTAEALPVLRRAEERCLAAHGAEHPMTRRVSENRKRIERLNGEMEALDPEGFKAESAKVGEKVKEMLAAIKGVTSQENKGARYDELTETLRTISERIASEVKYHPLAEMRVRGRLGQAFQGFGRYGEAEIQFSKALQIAERYLGNECETTLAARGFLGAVQSLRGYYQDAEANLRHVIRGRMKLLGPGHSETLAARVSFTQTLLGMGKRTELEAENQDVLEAYRRMLGNEHPKTLTCRANLCVAWLELGRAAEAEAELRSVMDAEVKVLGPQHPKVFLARNNLVCALIDQGKFADAESELRTNLPAYEKALGAQHPDALLARVHMGNVLCKNRKFSEAETVLRDLIPLLVATLGEEHHLTLAGKLNLAMARHGMSQSGESEAEIRRVVEKQIAIAPDSSDTLEGQTSLAMVLQQLGKVDDARLLARNVAETRLRLLGPDDPRTKAAEKFCGQLEPASR